MPNLPAAHGPSDRIETPAESITNELVFIALDLIPPDCATVDFLQLNYDVAGLIGTEFRHQSAEWGIANRLASNSYEAVDDETAAAYLVSEADGVNVALCSVRIPPLHLCQPSLCCEETDEGL